MFFRNKFCVSYVSTPQLFASTRDGQIRDKLKWHNSNRKNRNFLATILESLIFFLLRTVLIPFCTWAVSQTNFVFHDRKEKKNKLAQKVKTVLCLFQTNQHGRRFKGSFFFFLSMEIIKRTKPPKPQKNLKPKLFQNQQ